MKILFPSEPFNTKEVDSSFTAEYEAAKLNGFEVFLFDHDEMVKTGQLKSNLPILDKEYKNIILRSWMLNALSYACLEEGLAKRGYNLINVLNEYLNCHYFTNAFPVIHSYTSKSWWTFPWHAIQSDSIRAIDWKPIRDYLGGDVIIKDYVKSEKGNPDLFILKKELDNDKFGDRVLNFIEARGKLFNVGLVFKEIVSLKKYEGQTNEWRLFFLQNKLLICNQNSDTPKEVICPSDIVISEFSLLAKKINSNFFTMDIAEKEDGTWMILELGDGQVSGLPVKGDAIGFYNKLNRMLSEISWSNVKLLCEEQNQQNK